MTTATKRPRQPAEHRPVPVEDKLGVLTCAVCGRAVRTAFGGTYAIHASVR